MDPAELAAVLRGEPGAVRDFVREYGPVLQAGARRKVHGELRQGLDDLLQELMLGLFHDSGRVLRAWEPTKGRNLKSYLRDFAEKRTIDWLRRQLRNRREQPTDDQILLRQAEDGASGEPDEAPDWLEPLWNRFHAVCSAEDAQLLDMFYGENRTAQQIATALGVSQDVVYQRKHRLKERLQKMRKELSEQGELGAYNPPVADNRHPVRGSK